MLAIIFHEQQHWRVKRAHITDLKSIEKSKVRYLVCFDLEVLFLKKPFAFKSTLVSISRLPTLTKFCGTNEYKIKVPWKEGTHNFSKCDKEGFKLVFDAAFPDTESQTISWPTVTVVSHLDCFIREKSINQECFSPNTMESGLLEQNPEAPYTEMFVVVLWSTL